MTTTGASVAFNARLGVLLDVLDKLTIAVAGLALLAMCAVEAWQVFARYVLNDSPSWTEPLALLFMSTTMMLGAAAGVRSNRHFGFFILVESVKPPLRRVLRAIALLIAAAIGLMLAVWGAQMLVDAWDYPIAGAPLPQGVAATIRSQTRPSKGFAVMPLKPSEPPHFRPMTRSPSRQGSRRPRSAICTSSSTARRPSSVSSPLAWAAKARMRSRSTAGISASSALSWFDSQPSPRISTPPAFG
jgi:TRAP-type C4-dicarboxylate transport system permease small subunit